MKNLFTLLTIILLAGTQVNALAAKTSKDSTQCLNISGKIANLNAAATIGDDNLYKVELIYYNTVIDSITKRNNQSFKFVLKRDAIYTLRISKKGYITKLVSINTALDPENKEYYYFHFNTDLLKEDMKKVLDEEALEFPITIVSFDEDANIFYYNKEYTSNIKHSMFSCEK